MFVSAIKPYVFTQKIAFKSSYESNDKYSSPYNNTPYWEDDADPLEYLRDYHYNSLGIDVRRKNNMAETIKGFEEIGYNSYIGESLVRHTSCLPILKDLKVKTIIDLHGYKDLENACIENGLNYYKYPIKEKDITSNAIFCDNKKLIRAKKLQLEAKNVPEKEQRKIINDYKEQLEIEKENFLDNFGELLDVVNEGNFYMGCSYGMFRTPVMLTLCTYFNPDWHDEKFLPLENRDYILGLARNMYSNLNENDKQRLGIDSKYEEYLKRKLNIND